MFLKLQLRLQGYTLLNPTQHFSNRLVCFQLPLLNICEVTGVICFIEYFKIKHINFNRILNLIKNMNTRARARAHTHIK